MIDSSKLCIGDYVLTSSISPLACAIRARTAGISKTFSIRIANHAGIIYSLDGSEDPSCLFIAEMLTNIRSTAIAEYEQNTWWGGKIIMVRRNPIYANPMIRNNVNQQIRQDLCKAVDYDYKGILEYLWPAVKDRPDEFYCSEYLRHLAQLNGGDIVSPNEGKEDDISPVGIQWATNISTIWTRI
jgi:hypothetical protein